MRSVIRLLAVLAMLAPFPASAQFAVSDWVLAQWRGGAHYYPATVLRTDATRVTVEYDDGARETRRQVLISRDFQEQRNQSVVFLLDTGRRMRALDGGVPQFDHVLNAILLVSHVALRQGDQVAVKSFGGSDRWLPPVKGSHAMPVLLNHLYDYRTTPAPSDFSGAVEQLMARQRRRSLVILLTNLRGEDGKELVPGDTWKQSKRMEGMVTDRVKLDTRESLYANTGDVLPAGCWAFLIIMDLAARVRRWRRNKHITRPNHTPVSATSSLPH